MILQSVVEQLVDGAGSYGRWRFQYLQDEHATWRKKLTNTTKNVLKRLITDNLSDLCWGQSAVDAEEVCGETSNVRGSHRGSRDHIGPPIVPSGNDVQTRSPDIDGSTEIGEVGLDIGNGRSSDGKSLQNASGRVFARVIVIVSGSDSDGNTAVVKLKTESLVSGVPSLAIHSAHTATTALSRASEGPPPKLIEATEGIPVLLASWETQLTPAIL